MSIKTASDAGLTFGESTLVGFNGQYANFACSCGSLFEKRKYKPYTEPVRDMDYFEFEEYLIGIARTWEAKR